MAPPHTRGSVRARKLRVGSQEGLVRARKLRVRSQAGVGLKAKSRARRPRRSTKQVGHLALSQEAAGKGAGFLLTGLAPRWGETDSTLGVGSNFIQTRIWFFKVIR